MVCYDVQIEPVLQPITGKELARGTNLMVQLTTVQDMQGLYPFSENNFQDSD